MVNNMDKLAYIGVINPGENVEYPLSFSNDGIYEVVCKLNGSCEIKIKSINYIDTHEIHKDYYKFHINVISRREYILSIQGSFQNQCSYNIIFKNAYIDEMYVSKYQWYIKNYITGIDINILPVIDLCNKVDTRLGIIDAFIDANNEERNTNESDILSLKNHGEYISSIIIGKYPLKGFYSLLKLGRLNLYPIFKFDDDQYRKKTSDYFIDAISEARRNNVRVLNCSFGGWEYLESEYNAIKNARDILFVVSAGNNSTNIDVIPKYPACYNLDNIIVVGAVDKEGSLYKTSNYGKTVDIFAPGEDICGLIQNGSIMLKASGTSGATAFVTALASLLIKLNHKLTPKDIKSLIKSRHTEIISKGTGENIRFINFEKSVNYFL